MAITKSAKKAHRASLKKGVFNLRRRRAVTKTTKSVRKLVVAGDTKAADASLPAAFQAIDKAVKRGIIKKNTAARKKSRLVASIRRTEVKAS